MEVQVKLLPGLSNKRMVIILENTLSPSYFRYLWVIFLNAHRQGTHVTIFDCDWEYLEFTNKHYDPSRNTTISKIRDEFFEALSAITSNAIKVVKISVNEINIDKKDITDINSIFLAYKLDTQLGNSLKSVFARNYLATSNLTIKGAKMRKQLRIYVQSFLSMQLLCQNILSSGLFDLILIGNGRFPHQAAMRVVAEKTSTEYFFYEHGMPKGQSFHFAPFQTQEFAKMQRFIQNKITEELECRLDDVTLFANDWLYNQSTNINQNPFLNTDSDMTKLRKQIGGRKLAVIFNSSMDEKFSNMGADLNGWESQKQAISAIAGTLVKQGFYVVVRIHPNTANKSWWDLINLVHYLKENEVDYILPWNGPSSYTLLEESDLVLTWGSTICMEAVARGIPTVVFGRTMYDEIAGATIVDPYILRTIDFNSIGDPDPLAGKIAAYFNKHWGYSLYDYCATQDLQKIDKVIENYKDRLVYTDSVKGKQNCIKRILVSLSSFFVTIRRIRKGRYSSPNDYRRFVGYFLPEKISNLAASLALSLGLKFKSLTKNGEVSI